jgi:lysozyme
MLNLFQEIPMSPVIGPDVSFYQNNIETEKRIDFVKMHTLAEYVIIRAGQNLWMDRDIKVNWSDAKDAGIPRGSYWFYDSRANPKRQADLWVQALGDDLGELPMFLDLEENYGGRNNGWKDWRIFLEHLKTLVGQKEISIYTGYYYFREHTSNQSSIHEDLEYFHQYPLWIANYKMPIPLIPLPWADNEWLFWQYTAKGDGKAYGVESTSIDLNYFNGNLNDFRRRFMLPEPPPSAPETSEPPIELPIN